jgi:hypothetical protein
MKNLESSQSEYNLGSQRMILIYQWTAQTLFLVSMGPLLDFKELIAQKEYRRVFFTYRPLRLKFCSKFHL